MRAGVVRLGAAVAVLVATSVGCTLLSDLDAYSSGSGDASVADGAAAEGGALDGAVVPEGGGEDDAAVKDAYVVVAGGDDDTNLTSAVYVARIEPDGNLGAWASMPALPESRHRGTLVAAAGTLLYIAGFGDVGGTRASLFGATFVPPPGPYEPWASLPSPISGGRSRHGSVIVGDRLYVTGGRGGGGTTFADVQMATVTDGVVGPFAAQRSLPEGRENHVTVASGSHLWIFTGTRRLDGGTLEQVGNGWVTDVDPATGAVGDYRPITPLPDGRTVDTGAGVATASHVYLVGGYANGPYGAVKAAPIGPNGALGPWFDAASLQEPRAAHAVVYARDRIYAIGGLRAGSEPLATVEVADTLPNGTLTAWRSTTPLPVATFTLAAALVER